MNLPPLPAKDLRPRSRLRPSLAVPLPPLVASDAAREAKQLAAGFQKDLKRLTTAQERQRFRSYIDAANADWQRRVRELRGDATVWEQEKKAFAAEHRRGLLRQLGRVKGVTALIKQQRKAVGELFATITRPPRALPTGPFLPLEPAAKPFAPPFDLFNVEIVPDRLGELKVTDRSFALPASGQLVIDCEFNHSDSTGGLVSVFGLLDTTAASVIASCGPTYKVPADGRLRAVAQVQNLYNHTTVSLRDRFGLSGGDVQVAVNFVLTVRRPNRVDITKSNLLSLHLGSDGDDRDAVLPDIDQSAPLQVEIETEEAYRTGETVWLFLGMEVQVGSVLDDMRSRVRSVIWSEVRQLNLSIVA